MVQSIKHCVSFEMNEYHNVWCLPGSIDKLLNDKNIIWFLVPDKYKKAECSFFSISSSK